MTSPRHWLPALLCCLPLASCCNIAEGMAALFCGPSTQPLVTVSYRTPEEALRTFQKAVAGEHARLISRSFSPGFKRRHNLGELEMDAVLSWLREEYPGFHVVGRARIVETPVQEPTVVEHVLEVAFHRFRVVLRRYDYWSVVVPGPGQPIPKGDYLPDFSRSLRVRHRGEMSDIAIQITDLEIPDLLPEDILEVTLGREWKVDAFERVAGDRE